MPQPRFLVLRATFNELATQSMHSGALRALQSAGIDSKSITSVDVPGCFELPVVAAEAARSGNFDAIVAIGCVIRGETPHFDFVAGECARGLMAVSTETGIPVGFGVITTDTMDQALARCGLKAGNKGADAALAALSTLAAVNAVKKG